MTLVIALPDDLENTLRQRAAAAGKDVATFAREAVEEKLHRPRTLDEILAPHRKQVVDSGNLAASVRARFAPLAGVELAEPLRQPTPKPPDVGE